MKTLKKAFQIILVIALAISLLATFVVSAGSQFSMAVGNQHFAFPANPEQSESATPTFLALETSGGSSGGG